jgi:DNA-binding NarL/FixJ family response regulator
VSRQRKKIAPLEPDAVFTITENQRGILLWLFAGCKEAEIAAATGRKRSTIYNTLKALRDQLAARTGIDLMRGCLRRGVVTLDEIYAAADALRNCDLNERARDDRG